MLKTGKILAAALVGLALLLALVLAILPSLLDTPALLRDHLARACGRPVKVQGARLSLITGGELEVRGLVIDELAPFGRRPLLKLAQLELEFKLWPLLWGRLVVDQAQLQGLELSLARDGQGQINWAGLPGPWLGDLELLLTGLACSHGVVHVSGGGQERRVPIQELALDSGLGWGGARLKLAARISGLRLKLQGASQGGVLDPGLGPSQMELDLDLAALGQDLAPLFPGLAAQGQLSLDGKAQGPLSAIDWQGVLVGKNLKLSGGPLAGSALQLASLEVTSHLTVHPTQSLLRLLSLEAKAPPAGWQGSAAGVWGWGEATSRTRLNLEQKADLARLVPWLEPIHPLPALVQGHLRQKTLLTRQPNRGWLMQGQARVQDLAVRPRTNRPPLLEPLLKLDYDLGLDPTGQALSLAKLAVDCGPARLGVKGRVTRTPQGWDLDLNLRGEYLDLDRAVYLLPLPRPRRQIAQEAPAETAPAAPAATKAEQAPTPPAPDPEADRLKAQMAGLAGRVDLDLGELIHQGRRWRQVRGVVRGGPELIKLEELSCRLQGGELKLRGSLDLASSPVRGSAVLEAANVPLNPELYSDLKRQVMLFPLPPGAVRGEIDLKAELGFSGLSENLVRASLAGWGKATAPRGVTIDYRLLHEARAWGSLLDLRVPGHFDTGQGDFKVAQGRVDYAVTLGQEQGRGLLHFKGFTNLADDSIEVTVRVEGDKGLAGRLKTFADAQGRLPVSIRGTIKHPLWRLERIPIKGIPGLELFLRKQ